MASLEEESFHSCTPCWVDGTRNEAIKYCPECREFLCETCIRYHRRMSATREHKLMDKNEIRQADTTDMVKCEYHPDRDVEMYCGTHDMVYCLKCIANNHRYAYTCLTRFNTGFIKTRFFAILYGSKNNVWLHHFHLALNAPPNL